MVLKYKTKLSRCLWRRKKESPSSKTLKSLKSQNKIFEDGEVYWRKETGREHNGVKLSKAEREHIPFRQNDGEEKYSVR